MSGGQFRRDGQVYEWLSSNLAETFVRKSDENGSLCEKMENNIHSKPVGMLAQQISNQMRRLPLINCIPFGRLKRGDRRINEVVH